MFALLSTLVACLLVSFAAAVVEGAVSAIAPSRLESLKRAGARAGLALASLRERLDESRAALLGLSVAANTIAAVVVGVFVAQPPSPARVTAAAASLTLVFLFVGQALPRSLGAAYAGAIAPRVALPLERLVRALRPLVAVSLSLRKLFRHRDDANAPTAADVVALTSTSARAGNLEPREVRWVANALKLSGVTVRQIMTPRSVVYGLPAELALDAVKARSEHWVHSRLPIFRERNPDEIVGLVLRRTVFDMLMRGDTQGVLEKLALPVQSVPDSMTADHLLEWFVSKRQHLAIVRDEFQAYVGVVTLEDVLETFLGAEIVDEHDPAIDMRELAKRRAVERGVVVPQPPPERVTPRADKHR